MTAKFLIAPTFVIGKNYLRKEERSQNEWKVLVGSIDDIPKIQGLSEAEIEYIPSLSYANPRLLDELLYEIQSRGLVVKEVVY